MEASVAATEKNSERKFLHDISSPLTTAIFLLDILLDSAGEKLEIEKLTKLQKALKKSQDLVRERREILQASAEV